MRLKSWKSVARVATTQPTQALTMLNGAFVNERATRFAERLERVYRALLTEIDGYLMLA